MKIEKAAPRAEVEDEGGDDKRRARLADLQRLEAALNVVTGKLAEVERLLAGRDTAPISRSMFYANYYTFSALHGTFKAHALRDKVDAAWDAYQEALTMAPRRSLDEIYGQSRPAPLAATPPRPLTEPTPVGEPTPASLSGVYVAPTATETVVPVVAGS